MMNKAAGWIIAGMLTLSVTSFSIALQANHLAEKSAYFNDRGTFYNWFDFVDVKETVPGVFSLKFKNEQEFYYNHFVVTSAGVVVFDPLSDSAAEAMVDVIREKAPGQPLAAIVYSHLHTDHIAGARVLRKAFGSDTPIIAHKRTRRYFSIRKVPFIDMPTEVVGDEGKTYQFGDTEIQLQYLGDVHTASILVPVLPEKRVAYTVDYINGDVVGWTDLPGINLDVLMAQQRRTLELDADTFLFGHGAPGNKATLQRQIDYFTALQAEARKALAAGWTEDQAAERIELEAFRHFANYDDWFEGNVRAFYRWEKNR
ncbi:MBL fold metallo-hydrolase [Aliamphritea spongicola]|uniref:MBL fold metallo-hydrolase n=1 Tax=Aliamphritea spongicola TaxID=707589 RepID=UPI00196B77D5|nr:MBL fold metallo-hydrolase [Aliamphritea spongicola]MBN3561494.1 MBL fold metallo-hydrolase [Aliamphritea spongicola]